MAGHNKLAVFTWYCDLGSLLLTLLYSGLVLSDVGKGGAVLTSPAWYKEGFCVWRGACAKSVGDECLIYSATSHTLCTRCDLPIGTLLMVLNVINYRQQTDKDLRVGLQLAIAASAFAVLHGLGHIVIDHVRILEEDMNQLNLDWLNYGLSLIGSIIFLLIGPFVGWMFGMPVWVCVPLHIASSWAFVHLPHQFKFGGVQFLINIWYCVPRILWIGTEGKEALSLRVLNGWAVNSIGNLMLMPLVFSEAFACETFYRACGGHALYDWSLLVIAAANAWVLWQQGMRRAKQA